MSILGIIQRCKPENWQLPLELTPLTDRGGRGGLWIDPVALLEIINGWELTRWALRRAAQLQPWCLPKPCGPGAPQQYRDESVLLTSLVAAA